MAELETGPAEWNHHVLWRCEIGGGPHLTMAIPSWVEGCCWDWRLVSFNVGDWGGMGYMHFASGCGPSEYDKETVEQGTVWDG